MRSSGTETEGESNDEHGCAAKNVSQPWVKTCVQAKPVLLHEWLEEVGSRLCLRGVPTRTLRRPPKWQEENYLCCIILY